MAFKYDVFLSYSSQDEAWATGLFGALTSAPHQFKVFQDKQGLIAGQPWEASVKDALNGSKHLVVLWSGHAKESDWVTREIVTFEQAVRPAGNTPRDYQRLTMIAALEDVKSSFQSLHMNKILCDPGGYGNGTGFAGCAPGLWKQFVTKVVNDINSAGPSRPIRVAVLAMTDAELDSLPKGSKPPFARYDFDDMLINLGMPDRAALKAQKYYGKERDDWRPFGNPQSVGAILSQIPALYAPPPGTLPIRWEPAGDDFWDNPDYDAALREAKKLISSEPSVVVIDPLSLYHPTVKARLDILDNSLCFRHPACLILVLTPFPMPSQFTLLRNELWTIGRPQLTFYSDIPTIGIEVPFASCFVNVGDESEVRRLLRLNLGAPPVAVAPSGSTDFTLGTY